MQAKFLLSILLATTVLVPFAQKPTLNQGDEWVYHYTKSNVYEVGKLNENVEATVAFKVKSKLQNGNYNVEVRFPFVLYKHSDQNMKLVFNSAHADLNADLDRTTAVLDYFFLYSQPLEIEAESGKKMIAIHNNITALIDKKLTEWQIKEGFKKDAEKNIANTVTDILNAAFSPSAPISAKPKNLGEGKQNGGIFKKQFLQKEITVSPQNNRIKSSELENKKNSSNKIDATYFNMVIDASFLSDALNTNGLLDSIKTVKYINEYNPQYSNNRNFVLNKLSLLQQIHDWPRYDSELKTIPVKLLEGSYHLSNRINDNDISDKDFDEIVPLLDESLLYDWLQHSFSQSFLRNNNNEGKLNRLANHPTEHIRIATLPMRLWVRATENKNNVDSLRNISNIFSALSTPYWNQGNASRYALLTYKIMDEKSSPSAVAFLETIKAKILPLYQDSLNEKRYEQKADLAYAWYLGYLKNKDKSVGSSMEMLAKAAFYSPKSQAETAYGSFYDRAFLKSKVNYTNEYYMELAKNGMKEKAMQLYIGEFLNNPAVTFAPLKLFYKEQYKNGSFATFFKDTILQKLPNAPMFHLENLTGQKVTLSEHRGKWLLIDFWGTWCGPCVAEIPKINAYYTKLQYENSTTISLLTVACRDTKEKVQAFQQKNSYAFPALLADEKVESEYKIASYPTKVIISPEGKMIPVYFGSDWEGLMESLSKL